MVLGRLSKVESTKGKVKYIGYVEGVLIASMSPEGDLVVEFIENSQPSLFTTQLGKAEGPKDEF